LSCGLKSAVVLKRLSSGGRLYRLELYDTCTKDFGRRKTTMPVEKA
jgi:hypothetical protein